MKPKQLCGAKKLNKDKGSAMIVALVVCVVVMTLCLTLLLVCYTLFAQTSRQNVQMQCKIMAQSFSDSLEKELENSDSSLVKYLNECMDSTAPEKRWQAIDADENNDPNYSDSSRTELLLAVDDVEGYVIRVSVTYELPDEIDPDEPTVSENGTDDEDGRSTSPLACFTVTCQRGEVADSESDTYTVESYYNIPKLDETD